MELSTAGSFAQRVQWDSFVYWPTGDYPESMYGGHVERIDGWAYVHE